MGVRRKASKAGRGVPFGLFPQSTHAAGADRQRKTGDEPKIKRYVRKRRKLSGTSSMCLKFSSSLAAKEEGSQVLKVEGLPRVLTFPSFLLSLRSRSPRL